MNTFCLCVASAALLATGTAMAQEIVIPMHLIDEKGVGRQIGTVVATEGPGGGITLQPMLADLPPGLHGFHIHENGSCDPKEQNGKPVAGLAAGGHYDPDKTGRHEGPGGQGHRGDLPALDVAPDGTTPTSIGSKRLVLSDLRGKSLVIHAGGDNYSDKPAPLGGGGARIACGVVP